MSGLEALLISSIDDEIPINKFFPTNYSDHKNLTELLIISKYFNKCGKGCLYHKNKIFYYRTYIPALHKQNQNSHSESFSDYFIYSYDCQGKKFFLLFLCNLSYKVKNIDNLTIKIFEILDNNAFEDHKIKNESFIKISNVFEQYKKLESNLSEYNQLREINITNDSSDSINSSNSSVNSKRQKVNVLKKRIDTRMVLSKTKKDKSDIGSIDLDDLTTVKESDTDLSLKFKQDFDKELFLPQIRMWKIIKIVNIVLCIILFIIMLIVIIYIIKNN